MTSTLKSKFRTAERRCLASDGWSLTTARRLLREASFRDTHLEPQSHADVGGTQGDRVTPADDSAVSLSLPSRGRSTLSWLWPRLSTGDTFCPMFVPERCLTPRTGEITDRLGPDRHLLDLRLPSGW